MIPRAKVGFQDSVYQYQGELDEGITGKVYEEGIGQCIAHRMMLLKIWAM